MGTILVYARSAGLARKSVSGQNSEAERLGQGRSCQRRDWASRRISTCRAGSKAWEAGWSSTGTFATFLPSTSIMFKFREHVTGGAVTTYRVPPSRHPKVPSFPALLRHTRNRDPLSLRKNMRADGIHPRYLVGKVAVTSSERYLNEQDLLRGVRRRRLGHQSQVGVELQARMEARGDCPICAVIGALGWGTWKGHVQNLGKQHPGPFLGVPRAKHVKPGATQREP